mgnify:CR=1 FL=1
MRNVILERKVEERTAEVVAQSKEIEGQKVRIEDLYFDNDDIIGKQKAKYMSVALVGNAENTANCTANKPCLGNLVQEDMFRMYSGMPDSVVEVIWGAGMKDVGFIGNVARTRFVKVFPTEYKRALAEIYERKVLEESATPAVAATKNEAVPAK